MLDNQEEGTKYRTIRLRTALGEMFPTPTFLGPTLFQLLWRYRAWNIGPGVCDIHRRRIRHSSGHTKRPGLLCQGTGCVQRASNEKRRPRHVRSITTLVLLHALPRRLIRLYLSPFRFACMGPRRDNSATWHQRGDGAFDYNDHRPQERTVSGSQRAFIAEHLTPRVRRTSIQVRGER